jgi:hypothetical protein
MHLNRYGNPQLVANYKQKQLLNYGIIELSNRQLVKFAT